jgi:hypothetical protein
MLSADDSEESAQFLLVGVGESGVAHGLGAGVENIDACLRRP